MIKPILVKPLFDGSQSLFRFDNGYGASVIKHGHSHGADEGLSELAVLKFSGPGTKNGRDWTICYDTPITSDVMGYLEPKEVIKALEAIRDLE